MNLKKLFLMLTFFVLLGTTAFAQTYVSATNGDDTFGNGSIATPYRSITKAVAVLAGVGGTISVEAGVYSNALTGETVGPLTINDAGMTYTFVGTLVGVNTTVSIAAGFTLTAGTVNMGLTGTAAFDFGASTVTLTAGALNIATANFKLGSGATLSIANGTLNTLPTVGANTNVTFNGTAAVASTSAFLPSNLGTGVLTISKASGAITIDNAALTTNGITINNVATVTINSNITSTANIAVGAAATVNLNGNITMGTATSGAQVDITNTTGTVSIGASSSNTLTLYTTVAAGTVGTDANVGEVKNTGAGSITINSTVTENIKNTGTNPNGGDQTALTVTLPLFTAIAGNITVNGNIAFTNTNVRGTAAGDNQVSHTVTLSNSGTGIVAFAGSITTPASTEAFTTPENAAIWVKLSNTGGGTFTTRSAALRGVAATEGISNKTAAGTMTLGQAGDVVTADWDVMNDFAASSLTINAGATFGGAFTNNNATSLVTFTTNAEVKKLFTNVGKVKLNATTLTLSLNANPALNNATATGDIYSVTSTVTGSGLVKFTGATSGILNGGKLPNVEYTGATAFTIATGNTIYGNLVTSGAGTATIGGASDIKGNLNPTGTGLVTINGTTTVRGSVNMTSASVTMGTAGLTVEGTFNMSSGTFTFGANTLTLKGNFNRTAGTIDAAAAGTGTLNFAGATNQTFTPGTQMNVFNVTVNNTGNYLLNVIDDNNVTVNASLIVLKDFTITTGRVLLGSSNIRMAQTGGVSARFTNGGRGYTATGIGGIIFEGTGANAVGDGSGAVITGTNPFSNIYVRLSVNANNVFALGAVSISGTVTLDGGGIVWNAVNEVGAVIDLFTASTLTLDDALVVPTVVINTQNTHGSPYLVDGGDGGAVALAITSVYNLTYTGQTARTITGNEFITTKVNNLSITAGTVGKTITGVVGTIVGNLTVDNGETLDQTAGTLTLSGNTAAHVVNGSVTVGTLAITGNAASLTGGSGTGNASSVAILTVTNAAGTFTSTGMKVLGTVTINGAALNSTITMNSATATLNTFTNTAGTTALNMNSTAVTAGANYTVTAGAVTLTMNGAAAGTATIGGTLAVNGGSLTLGSHVWVTGAVTHNGAGVIGLGNFNLTLANNYTHDNTATFTAGTGALVATAAATRTYTLTTTVDVPNFTLNAATGIQLVTSALTVSNKFVHTAGDMDVNGLALNISGNTYTYTAGTYTNTAGTAAGKVVLKGTALTITAAGNPAFGFLEVNSVGGLVTFASSSTTTPRSFQVANTFTHTEGNIALGFNDLEMTQNAGPANAIYSVAATAGSVTGTATGANLGEVLFSGTDASNQALNLAADYSIQNLRIANTAHLAVVKGGTASKVLTVVSNLGLADNLTVTTSSKLVLGDGCTINRTSGVFDVAPTFGATVNVNYTPAGALNSDVEIPVTATVLNNLTITSGAPVLTANATVNGTLFLVGGTISTGTKTLTIVDGGTIDRSGGAFAGGANDVPTVTTYKLVYSGGGAIVDGVELISTKVTDLTVSMTAAGVTLGNNRTVGNFNMSPTGAGAAGVTFAIGTDAATQTLTVTGTTTINNGIVSTQDATGATSTSASTLAAQGSVVVNGGSLGSLGTDNGAGVDGGLNLTFSGSAAQALTLNGNITIPSVTLNSTGTTAANAVVNVTGGNLTITNLLTFQNGILNMGSNTLYLPRPTGAANGGLAFDRTAVGVGEFGHVVGKISRQALSNDGAGGTNGRFEFPVGTLSGQYRPAAINFTPSYVVNNPVSIEVEHKDSTPEGTVGLPLNGGNGVTIGNYAQFFWLVNTTPSSLSSTQNFDIDLQANNIGVPYTSDQSLRIVRRQDGSATTNGWSMQGAAANYANYQVVTGIDTTVVARTTSSQGGLVVQGSRFAIGVPSRAPNFTAPVLATFTLAEGATTANTIQFTAVGLNSNDGAITYSKISGPAWAALNATTGLVTLTPGYSDAGTATLVVRATTATNLVAEKTVTITVTNSDQGPVLAAATATVNPATATTGNGVAKTVTYVATDADADVVTYSYTVTPTPSAGSVVFSTSLGTLTFTPAFADVANSPFTFTVTASSGTPALTAVVNTVFTVTYSTVKGDVNLSGGTITSADALLVLNYVVNPVAYPLTAEQLYAADVNNDDQVGAYDAASILVKAGGGNFLPKSVAAAGSVAFGKFTNEKGVFTLPINLENTAGVNSFYSEIQLGNSVEFTGVSSRLPEGWIMASNFENGTLKIAMAGLTPLTNGSVALVNLSLKDKDASVSIQGNAVLNDQLAGALNAVKVKEIPSEFSLSQNYPNPFNPTTNIKYAIAQDARVSLVVYNILGQAVRTLVNAEQESGYYTVRWDGTNDFGSKVSSGIYIYRISAGNFTSTVKMNLLK